MHVLRAEKGYIIVGQDTDGTLTPDDAGLAWAIGKAKPDFVGKRSLARPDMVAKGRKQLVGLLTDDPKVGAAGRRPDRRRPEPAEADDHARPRHLLLLERGARPLDRHGGRRRRPRARRRDAARPDAGPAPSPPAWSGARSSTTPKARASAPEMESSMNAMTAPFAAGVTITELPPTTRISLRLADPAAARRSASRCRRTDRRRAAPRAPAPPSASAPTSG